LIQVSAFQRLFIRPLAKKLGADLFSAKLTDVQGCIYLT